MPRPCTGRPICALDLHFFLLNGCKETNGTHCNSPMWNRLIIGSFVGDYNMLFCWLLQNLQGQVKHLFTSNSNCFDKMKNFLKKSIYFSIPLITIMGSCLYLLCSSGEIYSNETIIRPLKEQQLIGLAYTEINEYYKFEMCDRVFCPDIIALGSSRIMQVKKNIVSDNYTFYNAGGAVNNIYQFKHFLDNLHIKQNLYIHHSLMAY